jgi:hypothetical protein
LCGVGGLIAARKTGQYNGDDNRAEFQFCKFAHGCTSHLYGGEHVDGHSCVKFQAALSTAGAFLPQQRLYFWPELQGHGALRAVWVSVWVCLVIAAT